MVKPKVTTAAPLEFDGNDTAKYKGYTIVRDNGGHSRWDAPLGQDSHAYTVYAPGGSPCKTFYPPISEHGIMAMIGHWVSKSKKR